MLYFLDCTGTRRRDMNKDIVADRTNLVRFVNEPEPRLFARRQHPLGARFPKLSPFRRLAAIG
jgi:hypothetical protein